jgi:probable F420-dependent oxidoreductase
MQFWQAIARTDVDQLVPLARLAERLGFAGVTMSDHIVRPREIVSRYPYSASGEMATDETTPYLDPWVLVGALARATKRLRFMPCVTIPALRDPFSVAKAVATATILSNERVLMGIGVGWMKEEFDLVERAFARRGARTDELVAVVRKLLAGGMVEHHGEFYDFPAVEMAPVPPRCPPVLIGGHSPAALRRAAAAEGWLGVQYDVETAVGILTTLAELRHAAGRSGLPFDAAIALADAPGDNDLERLEKAGVTMIVHPPVLRPDGTRSGFEEKRDRLEAYAERYLTRSEA